MYNFRMFILCDFGMVRILCICTAKLPIMSKQGLYYSIIDSIAQGWFKKKLNLRSFTKQD